MDPTKRDGDSYDNDLRGEHRYPDAEQRPSEQDARRRRDALKQRLTGEDTRTRRPAASGTTRT
jgi:hypothetical protein